MHSLCLPVRPSPLFISVRVRTADQGETVPVSRRWRGKCAVPNLCQYGYLEPLGPFKKVGEHIQSYIAALEATEASEAMYKLRNP